MMLFFEMILRIESVNLELSNHRCPLEIKFSLKKSSDSTAVCIK